MNASNIRTYFFRKTSGLKKIVVFINNRDVIIYLELKDFVKMGIINQLNTYDFVGDNTPIIFGSALGALKGEV